MDTKMNQINTALAKVLTEMGFISDMLGEYKHKIKHLNHVVLAISVSILVCEIFLLVAISYFVTEAQKYLLLILNIANIFLIISKIAHDKYNKLLSLNGEFQRLSLINAVMVDEMTKPDINITELDGLLSDLRKINAIGF